jgi:uncharacterized protein with GYD domain
MLVTSPRRDWGAKGGKAMPKFITFFSYTGESAKAMIDRPSDRSAAARAVVESLGGTMEAFYWMQGKHDGFLISTLADGVSASALSLAVGSTGAIKGIESHQIFDRDEQAAIVKAAKSATYKPPTA